MNLGRTLVGAIVGAALGIGLQIAIEVWGRYEAPWIPLVLGLLIGWGVRNADAMALSGVSYARGALSAAVALGAIVGGPNLVAQMRSAQKPIGLRPPSQSAATPIDGKQTTDADAPRVDETVEFVDRTASRGPMANAQSLARRPDQFSTAQFIFMAVGMLLAYELARGTEVRFDTAEPTIPTEPASPLLSGADEAPLTHELESGGAVESKS